MRPRRNSVSGAPAGDGDDGVAWWDTVEEEERKSGGLRGEGSGGKRPGTRGGGAERDGAAEATERERGVGGCDDDGSAEEWSASLEGRGHKRAAWGTEEGGRGKRPRQKLATGSGSGTGSDCDGTTGSGGGPANDIGSPTSNVYADPPRAGDKPQGDTPAPSSASAGSGALTARLREFLRTPAFLSWVQELRRAGGGGGNRGCGASGGGGDHSHHYSGILDGKEGCETDRTPATVRGSSVEGGATAAGAGGGGVAGREPFLFLARSQDEVGRGASRMGACATLAP